MITLLLISASIIAQTSPPLDIFRHLRAACYGAHVNAAELNRDCDRASAYEKHLPSLGYCFYNGRGDLNSNWQIGKSHTDGSCL